MPFLQNPLPRHHRITQYHSPRHRIQHPLKDRKTAILKARRESLHRHIPIALENPQVGIRRRVRAYDQRPTSEPSAGEVFEHAGVVEDCGGAVEVRGPVEVVVVDYALGHDVWEVDLVDGAETVSAGHGLNHVGLGEACFGECSGSDFEGVCRAGYS